MSMHISPPDGQYRQIEEFDLMRECLPFDGATLLELGCGRAFQTRRMAEQLPIGRLIATEVDRVQHEKNLQIDDLPKVEFHFGGAEQIDLPEASIDIVIMLKSLHHVPVELMDKGLSEIARVLRPGGLAYLSEPIYGGAFNDILRLFHDEKAVREAAFEAIRRVVDSELLLLKDEIFFESTTKIADFAEFEQRFIGVTHTDHRLDDAQLAQVREAFERHMGPDGALFPNPHRVDLLQKPAG